MEFDLNNCFQASQLAVHSLELFVAVYPLANDDYIQGA